MKAKNLAIVMTFVAMIGGLVFYDQVAAIFAGMSPMDALNAIVTFILHVAVVTIAVWGVTTLPELIKPWMQTLRWKQRQARRGGGSASTDAQRGAFRRAAPRLTSDQMMKMYMMQFMEQNRSRARRDRKDRR